MPLMIEGQEVEYLIEILGYYDGWSVAKMKDGRMLNRWPPSDHRHKPTQKWIERAALGGDDDA